MKALSKLKSFLADLTNRELNLWAEFLVNIVVALYYFPKAFRLIEENPISTLQFSIRLSGLVVSTIVLTIIVSIILGIIVEVWKKPAKKDERDYAFSARGSMIAYMALFFFVSIVIGQVIFQDFFPETATRLGLMASPLIIAHLLLLSLMFSSTIKCVVQLFFYRRSF